ncbi:hypothetical protein TRFO_22397 [Tritrichomonas foetus]|uniref:Peptidase S8/S53 domain-containing protein n=1 Tax=Tritrichomonas foetus TaxID=1144522 RepID=A0A1J4KD62_9EUKA|nr:hypothetical protein TRFO_22397 [Tritrichomonas foetus]|eukprot:OHT08906.1 hypothetical protein TRFO_22397 [Tritrichomonas foetus]
MLFFFIFFSVTKVFPTGTADHRIIEFNKENTEIIQHNIKSSFEQWYYVYVDSKNPFDYLNLKYSIKATNDNKITSKTFSLYLSQKEVIRMLSDDSIKLRMLHDDEKYISDSSVKDALQYDDFQLNRLNKSNTNTTNEIKKKKKYYVFLSESYTLPISKHYQIESKLLKNCYLISIINEKESEKKAIEELSSLPYVQRISHYQEPQLKNILGAGFTQKNTREPQIIENTNYEYFERYINDKGITGQGEVVTVVDSLLDYNHDMFFDPNIKLEFQKNMANHRKIVYYDFESQESFQASIEDMDHGTHVSGTIAGQSICDNPYVQGHNGVAPDAKLMYINLDGLLAKEIMTLGNKMEEMESKICSNSWGSEYGFIKELNWLFGHSNNFRGSIFIFAAGNERNLFDNWTYFTICDPGGNKNVLTVGAINSLSNENNTVILEDVSGELVPITLKLIPEYSHSEISQLIHSLEYIVNLNIFISADEKLTCDYLAQGINVIHYGNAPVKCPNLEGLAFYTSDEKILQYSLIEKKIRLFKPRYANRSVEYESASYSSIGPAYKGMLKPDVVSPGTDIISAFSSAGSAEYHGCFLEGDNYYGSFGTSMATPNVAGATALVNQYFREKRNIILNGADLRALIIASASRPDHSKEPDMLMGHGIVDLSTILCFDKSFGVAISKQDSFIEHSNHVMTKITVKNKNSDLRIVLSYFDVELNIESMIPIMNDLDLVVISPNNMRYLGDNRQDEDSEHLSTNEKVIISKEELELGEYEIHIYSNVNEKQNFSVVSVGPVDDQQLIFKETLDCGCETCTRHGKCHCDSLHVGNHCQTEISEMSQNDMNISISHNSIKRVFLKFKSIDIIKIRRPNSINGSYSSVWFGMKCHSALSDFETYIGLEDIETNIIIESNEPICIAIFNNHFDDQEFCLQVIGEQFNPDIVTNSSSTDETNDSKEINDEIKTLHLGLILTGSILGVIIVILVVILVIILFLHCKRDSATTQQGYKSYR